MSDGLYESCYRRVVLAAYAMVPTFHRAAELATRVFAEMPASEQAATARVLALARRDRRLPRRARPAEPPSLPVRYAELLTLVDELPPEQRTAAVLHHLAGADESTVDSKRLREADAALAEATALPAKEFAGEMGELRELLTESIPRPELFEVHTRARERRTATRMKIGATLAVLAVGVTIPVLRGARPADPAQPAPAGTVQRSEHSPLFGLGGSDEPPFISSVDFADPNHGYALRGVCASSPTRRCRYQLLTTSDGQHWEVHRIPTGSATTGAGQLVLLGTDRIVVDYHTESGGAPTRQFSEDGGRTWRAGSAQPIGTVQSIPEHGAINLQCADYNRATGPCRAVLTVIDPATGNAALLADQPPLEMTGAPRSADQGAWWVSGKDPASGQQAIAASRDSGRSWTIKVLDGASSTLIGIDVQSGPGVLYVIMLGPGDGAPALSSIYRSTDAGATWQPTWQPGKAAEPKRLSGSMVVTPDGNLLVVTDPDHTYRSTDGGESFQPTDLAVGLGWIARTPGGYLGGTIDGQSYRYSPDVRTWITLTPPTN